jgi:hypothetical protein
MGHAVAGAGAKAVSLQSEPWNILVCTDLGFCTESPEKLTAAGFTEFMLGHPSEISGAIECSGTSFYLEYRATSLEDYSAKTVQRSVPQISVLVAGQEAVDAFSAGAISRDALIAALSTAQAPGALIRRLSAGQAPARNDSHPRTAASVDRILGMMAVAPESDTSPASGTDALMEAVTARDSEINPEILAEIRQHVSRQLSAYTAAVLAMPAFRARYSAWRALKRLLKAIGRDTSVTVSLCSAPAMATRGSFDDLLNACAQTGSPIDIVLFDHPCDLSTAAVEELSALARTAEQYKCCVIAPIAHDDALFQEIDRFDTLRPVFEEQRFLPFKRLRANVESRNIMLCGPDFVLPGDDSLPVSAPWFAVTWIAEALKASRFPWEIVWPTAFSSDTTADAPTFAVQVPERLVQEAGDFGGLMLFSQHKGRMRHDHLYTVVDNSAASPLYTHFGMNLLVNRVMRHAGKSGAASAIKSRLAHELMHLGCIASEAAITVTSKDGRVSIDITSDVILSDQPVRFAFDFAA